MYARCLIFLFFILFFIPACAEKSPVPETREIQTRLDLAERQMIMGNLRQALNELQAIKPEAVRVPRYHYNLGMVLLALGKTAEAESHLTQAVKIKTDYGEAWNNLGLVLQLRQKRKAAAHAFKQALALPNYPTPELAAYNLAKLYQEQSKSTQALSFALQAIRHNRDFFPALFLTASLYAKTGQPEKAHLLLESVLEKGSKKEIEQAQKDLEALNSKEYQRILP